jgi:diacylglycerol O-acyltransferase
MGLIHLVGSYTGQFTFSFTADREMLPDPETYAAALQDSIEEVFDAAAARTAASTTANAEAAASADTRRAPAVTS